MQSSIWAQTSDSQSLGNNPGFCFKPLSVQQLVTAVIRTNKSRVTCELAKEPLLGQGVDGQPRKQQ
jgi:hypothetical protein